MRFLQILIVVIFISANAQAQFDDRFYFPRKQWENIDTVKYREVIIKTDTSLLNGILLASSGKVPLATILYFHGAGGNVTTYVPIVKPFADAGFQVFMIDMQGYGKSTGKPTHLNIAHDAQIVFDSLIHLDGIAGTKIIVMGASMGTQVATKLAKDNQDKVAALVLEGTISSFTDIALDTSPGKAELIRKYLKSPYAPKDDIKLIKNMPKLIVHSTEDSTVPFAEGKLVYDNAVQPKELWQTKGAHLDAINLYRKEYINKVKTLIGK